MGINSRYQIGVTIPMDAGKDLERVTSERGWSTAHYARQAVLEKLARDMGQMAPAPAERRETTVQQP